VGHNSHNINSCVNLIGWIQQNPCIESIYTLFHLVLRLELVSYILNCIFPTAQTTNDVITGIIFLGTRLFMQEKSHESSEAHSTALVLLNTRMISSYKSIKEMVEPNSETPWGNRFGFLHVPIPNFKDPKSLDPLEFVWEAHKIIKRKRSMLDVYLTSRVLEIIKKIRGPEVHILSSII
jgi:hypothetical protein